MAAWVKDQADHENIKAMADGFSACIAAFAAQYPALELETLILEAKKALCALAPGRSKESTSICFRVIAANRVLGKYREMLA